jgi:hypothetical protein
MHVTLNSLITSFFDYLGCRAFNEVVQHELKEFANVILQIHNQLEI